MPSYWNNNGKYQEIYDRLWSELVPSSGPSQFVEGENLRAISKIYWDYCNNGFGNNMTGPFNWLSAQNMLTSDEIRVLSPYMNCRTCGHFQNQFSDTDPIMIVLEAVTNRVIERCMANMTRHEDDLFNYANEDDYPDDDEDDYPDDDDYDAYDDWSAAFFSLDDEK